LKRVLCKSEKSINQKEEGNHTLLSSEEFVNSKAFGVKRIRIYKFSIILKGEVKK
jgi:hypothetical protein